MVKPIGDIESHVFRPCHQLGDPFYHPSPPYLHLNSRKRGEEELP